MRNAGRMLALVALAACIAPPTQLAPAQIERVIAAPQGNVRAATIRVFAEHGFTVAHTDSASGVVQSNPLTVESMWENDAVMNRVDCGKDMVGTQRALSEPVTLTLNVITTATAEGTSVRLKGTGDSHDRSARAQAGRNPVSAAAAGGNPCVLKAAFVKLLLDEIEAQTIKP